MDRWLERYRPWLFLLLALFIASGGVFLWFRQGRSEGLEIVLLTPTPEAVEETGTKACEALLEGRINLNCASADLLEALPDIGPVLAERIVRYREEHGRFRRVEDLLEVSGIGPKTLDKLRDRVTID